MDRIDADRIKSDAHIAIHKSQEILENFLAAAQKCSATSADIRLGLERLDKARITFSDRRMSYALIAEYLLDNSFEQDLGNLGRLHDLWEIMLQKETDSLVQKDIQKELAWLKANSVRI